MKFNEAESMFSRFNPLVLPLDVAIETSQLMLDTLKMADDWQTNLDNDYFYHLSENYTVNFWREWGVIDDSTPYFITIFGVDSDGITDYNNRAWSNYVEPPDDEDECSIFVYKPCPFCGAEPSLEMHGDKPYVFCTNAACPILGCAPIALHLWNARPVEEGLIDRLHEAVSDNKQQAKEQTSERERRGTMKVSIAVERLQYGYVTVDVDSLDEAKEIQDFNGYDVTSQTTEDWHVPDTLLNKDGWYEVEEGEEAKLKPCPFCGGRAVTSTFYDWDDLEYMAMEVNDSESIDGEVTCENERCINGWYLPPEDWNTRPIEDDLRKRIAELEAVIEILEDQQREVKNHLIDKNLHIDSLYEEGYKLQQRIAELETKIRHNALWQTSEDAEERAHLEKLVPDLKKRIAELEAENAGLKAVIDQLIEAGEKMFTAVIAAADPYDEGMREWDKIVNDWKEG